MTDDAPDAAVSDVNLTNESTAILRYERRDAGARRGWVKVVLGESWVEAYWPPRLGDVIDPKSGTLKLRPRKDSTV